MTSDAKNVLQRACQDVQSLQAAKLQEAILEKFRDVASNSFADAEKKYSSVDKQVLALVIQVSAVLGMPAPKWAQDALARARTGGPLETWDDVLGRPAGPPDSMGKKQRPETAFRRGMLSIPIYATVQMLHSQGRKIEPDLFDEVGEKFDISGRTASRIYYDIAETAKSIFILLQERFASVVEKEMGSSVAGKEVVSLAMNATLSMMQRLSPKEFLDTAYKIREEWLSDSPIKGEAGRDIMGPETSKAYAHLSEIRKKLTKTS
jgi:hypothetical protein